MEEFYRLSLFVQNFAVAIPRVAAAFLILPLISQETMPSMVRNIFLVSIAIVVFPYIMLTLDEPLSIGTSLVPVVLKEAFIGLIIGFSFSIVFWILEGAGQVIDNKIGTTTAQITDPMAGHQTTLIGSFMSHFATYVFVVSGGLIVFLQLIIESYIIWPIHSNFPDLPAFGQSFFIERFERLMYLTLLMATPALLVLTIAEFGLGFVNRYAQQLNIFSLSMPIKAWLGILVIALMLNSIIEFIVAWLSEQQQLLNVLQLVLLLR